MELALSTISTDELRILQTKIGQELKIRKCRCSLTVEIVFDRFVVKAEDIINKQNEVKNIFERYGSGNILLHQNKTDELSFYFQEDGDANDCQYHIEKVTNNLKKLCC